MTRMKLLSFAILLIAGCADTAPIVITNGGREVVEFVVKRPSRTENAVVLRLERTEKRFRDWLRIEIPAWGRDEEDVLYGTMKVKAEYLRDYDNGHLERANDLQDGKVRILRSSGLAGANYRFECAITFRQVLDESGKELGKKTFEMTFDAPLRERQ